MIHRIFSCSLAALVLAVTWSHCEDQSEKISTKQALQKFNALIGKWKVTAQPPDKPKEFWTEAINWEWQFKGEDVFLRTPIERGKFHKAAELRWLADKNCYQLKLTTLTDEIETYEGAFDDKKLAFIRVDGETKDKQRYVYNLLHDARYLVYFEVQPEGKTNFLRRLQYAYTKEGEFAVKGTGKPECIVSGGLGTIAVMHNGKTYYVCCSGCAAAFKDDPETYIKEYEAKQKDNKE